MEEPWVYSKPTVGLLEVFEPRESMGDAYRLGERRYGEGVQREAMIVGLRRLEFEVEESLLYYCETPSVMGVGNPCL